MNKAHKPRVKKADKTIAQRVRKYRNKRKVTQEQLGRALGVTHQQIQKYEKGENRLAASILRDIADYLDIPVTILLYGEVSEGKMPVAVLWNQLPQGIIKSSLQNLIQEIVAHNSSPTAPANRTNSRQRFNTQ